MLGCKQEDLWAWLAKFFFEVQCFPWVTKELAYAYRHRVWSWLSSLVVGLIPSTGQMKETGPAKRPGPACPWDDTLRFCRTCSCASSGLRNFGMKARGKTDMENEVWNHPKLRLEAARVVGEVRCIRIYTYTYISNSTINDVFILSIVYQDLYPDMVRIY